MGKSFDLGDYVDVAARMSWFFERYPEGSLGSVITHLTENYVVVRAMAFRTPTDTSPGVGHAMELIPGRTPYTKDSELMNAETSAWGRALAAIGAPMKGHIASADELRAARTVSKDSCPHTNTEMKGTIEVCLECGAERANL